VKREGHLGLEQPLNWHNLTWNPGSSESLRLLNWAFSKLPFLNRSAGVERSNPSMAQSARLQKLLEAKLAHDQALSCIDQCVDAGALSVHEAATQRDQAAAALDAEKDNAGVAVEGKTGISPVIIGEKRKDPPKNRGRQAGSKNTPRTGIEDLTDATLTAVYADTTGMKGMSEEVGRACMIQLIHVASGSTAKKHKTNLDALSVSTLLLICADRKLDTNGDKEKLIQSIQTDSPGAKADTKDIAPAEGASQKETSKVSSSDIGMVEIEKPKKSTGCKELPKGPQNGDSTTADQQLDGKPKRARAATTYNLFMKDEVTYKTNTMGNNAPSSYI